MNKFQNELTNKQLPLNIQFFAEGEGGNGEGQGEGFDQKSFFENLSNTLTSTITSVFKKANEQNDEDLDKDKDKDKEGEGDKPKALDNIPDEKIDEILNYIREEEKIKEQKQVSEYIEAQSKELGFKLPEGIEFETKEQFDFLKSFSEKLIETNELVPKSLEKEDVSSGSNKGDKKQVDYEKKIQDEMKKFPVDWNKVDELRLERDKYLKTIK